MTLAKPLDEFNTDQHKKVRPVWGQPGPEADADEVLAYQRGQQWLMGQIPSLETFAQVLTGKDIRVKIGPIPCTDGKTIWLSPPKLAEGEEPRRETMANIYHEIAHCLETQVFEPPTSTKTEDSLKFRADKEYGSPAGHLWNAVEDGRVEARLYAGPAPGARKHIAGDTAHRVPDIVKKTADNDDMAVLMAAYLKSASYYEFVKEFNPRVQAALADPEIDQLFDVNIKLERSLPVVHQVAGPMLKRLRELKFFEDWDPRSMDPVTGKMKIIDWNDLTPEEQQALRDAVKNGQMAKPEDANTFIKNAPKDLQDEAKEKGEGGQGAGQEDESEQESAEGAESGEASGSADGKPDDRGRPGSGSMEIESELHEFTAEEAPVSGSSDEHGDSESDAPTPQSSPEPAGQETAAMSSDEASDEDSTLTPTEIEEAAKSLHAQQEKERLERVEDWEEKFSKIEDQIRPPHQHYVNPAEAKRLEEQSPKAQEIRQAMELKVGTIQGNSTYHYLFKEVVAEVPSSDGYENQLSEYKGVVAGELNRLRAVFKANEKGGFSGQYEFGTHLNSRSLPGFVMGEHLKPFDRRVLPKKNSYAVTLLMDHSGSMSGQKMVMARVALCLQAEMLSKLQIPFEILAFSTQGYASEHMVVKPFDERWGTEARAKTLSIRAQASNMDGLAVAWAWQRLRVRPEKTKILVTYSDGQPNPDTYNQIAMIRHTISQIIRTGGVAIGVGIVDTNVASIYPKYVLCNDVRTLPRLVTKKLEQEIKGALKR